jgi:hypothetical protein
VVKAVEVIQVIKTELELRGEGTKDSPVRRVTQYWDFEGNLLWEYDLCEEKEQST